LPAQAITRRDSRQTERGRPDTTTPLGALRILPEEGSEPQLRAWRKRPRPPPTDRDRPDRRRPAARSPSTPLSGRNDRPGAGPATSRDSFAHRTLIDVGRELHPG
jgi:hypothetical protein